MKIEYEFDSDYFNGFYIKINGKTNYYDIMQILNISYDKYTDLLFQFNAKYKSFYGDEGYYFNHEADCKDFIEMIERDYNSSKKENTFQNTTTSRFKIGDKVKIINLKSKILSTSLFLSWLVTWLAFLSADKVQYSKKYFINLFGMKFFSMFCNSLLENF